MFQLSQNVIHFFLILYLHYTSRYFLTYFFLIPPLLFLLMIEICLCIFVSHCFLCSFHQGSFNSLPLYYFGYGRSFLLPYVYCTHFNQLTSSSYVICLSFSRNSVHFLRLLLKQKPSYCLKSLELYINLFFLNCSDPAYC